MSCETLTAAVYNRGAGWQGDFLELWGNYGNRRLVYPRLCQVENKKLNCLLRQHEKSAAASAKVTDTTVCGRKAASFSSLFRWHKAQLRNDNDILFTLTARKQDTIKKFTTSPWKHPVALEVQHIIA